MTFDFHPEAEAEFEEAVAFYEDHAEGLGLDFAAEVREAINRAVTIPLAWMQIDEGGAQSIGTSLSICRAVFRKR